MILSLCQTVLLKEWTYAKLNFQVYESEMIMEN